MRISENMTILSCPDLKLSLHNVELICGLQFGQSQGIFFLLRNKDNIFPEMAARDSVRDLITRPKPKRDIENLSVHPFQAEVESNLNYLYETIKKETIDAVLKFQQKVCEANKIQLDLIYALTQSEHPNLITSLLYKNDLSYRTDFSKNVPTVYKCIEIYEYMFTKRQSCILEWRVKYI